MVVRRRLRSVLIPLALYAGAGGLAAYFIHNAKIGNRGLAAKQQLKIQIYAMKEELSAARDERAEWDRRLALLRAESVDRDLLEERARIILGRVHRNDVVIVGP